MLRATFPAGTVSGAPKVRAMEIIDELEPSKRGIYAGAVGYLGFNGDMDLAIAIRTAVVKDGMLYVQAGAGIVADSVPDSEWQETQNKARAVLRAAEMVLARPGQRSGALAGCSGSPKPSRVGTILCPRGYQIAWADENPVCPPYNFHPTRIYAAPN